jgi:aryl-alcohol dehydrogenase-like predicted oxidoreductase
MSLMSTPLSPSDALPSSGPSLLPGQATEEATRPRALGSTFGSRRRRLYEGGPWVSAVGFGTYRVGFSPALGAPESGEALESALCRGMNLVDSSSNYGNGQSELLVGRTLARLVGEGVLAREDVVLVTKAGYIQGNNMELAKRRVVEGRPFPEVSEFGTDVWHCIHPEFLRDQAMRSRERLGVETIDVLLLHNPEYLLKKLEVDGVAVGAARETFYARIEKAFACLEELANEGVIAAYGLSSNTLGMPEEDPSSVNLRRCHEIASALRPSGSRFKVAQCPFNWLEVAPAVFPVEGDRNTLQFAHAKGIGVLVNRPLNAMHDDGLIRLTRPTLPPGATPDNLDDAAKRGLANWTKLSGDLEALARRHLDLPGYEDTPLSQMVLATLMWHVGVTSVLVGARKTRYVDDAEEAAARPALLNASGMLAAIYDELEFHKDPRV